MDGVGRGAQGSSSEEQRMSRKPHPLTLETLDKPLQTLLQGLTQLTWEGRER